MLWHQRLRHATVQPQTRSSRELGRERAHSYCAQAIPTAPKATTTLAAGGGDAPASPSTLAALRISSCTSPMRRRTAANLPPPIPGQPRPARSPRFTELLYSDHRLPTMPEGSRRCSRHNSPCSTNPSPGPAGAGDAYRFRGPRVVARTPSTRRTPWQAHLHLDQ